MDTTTDILSHGANQNKNNMNTCRIRAVSHEAVYGSRTLSINTQDLWITNASKTITTVTTYTIN